MTDDPLDPDHDDGAGRWFLIGVLLGLGAVLLGLIVQSPAVFCAGPVVVAFGLFLIPRVLAAGVGALLPVFVKVKVAHTHI
jgi:hypothetical protein